MESMVTLIWQVQLWLTLTESARDPQPRQADELFWHSSMGNRRGGGGGKGVRGLKMWVNEQSDASEVAVIDAR